MSEASGNLVSEFSPREEMFTPERHSSHAGAVELLGFVSPSNRASSYARCEALLCAAIPPGMPGLRLISARLLDSKSLAERRAPVPEDGQKERR